MCGGKKGGMQWRVTNTYASKGKPHESKPYLCNTAVRTGHEENVRKIGPRIYPGAHS